jgi:predicted ATPase
MIHSIKLSNFLSFGDASEAIPLEKLNVLIGPNGSGKSNLLEAIELIKGAPRDFVTPIRDGGGVRDWLWKGAKGTPVASLEVVLEYPKDARNLRYALSFTEVGQRFEIVGERIGNERARGSHSHPYLYYEYKDGHAMLNVSGNQRKLRHEDIDPTLSILAQRRDPDQYPEITYLGQMLGKIRLYREWSFGRYTPPRLPQKADLPNDILDADSTNLGMVLNRMASDPPLKRRLLEALRVLYDGIDDYHVQIQGGTVQVFLHEGKFTIPATRLSDGTLRYLCLLAILCDPNPPPLICIEEPELGLHPDVLPTLAELIKEASERCQLIVTTHSDVLVDAMTDRPNAILVAEKGETGTTLRRMDAEQLKPWLEQYRLGELWTRGKLGGTRW